MQTLHLFAGAGGGLLADLILGHRPIGAVELDPYCCRVLRERAAGGWFPELRVHEGDVRLFNPSDYAGRVDCLAAGFPCQPHSVAGKREGEADERNLWPDTKRIIGELRPRFVWLENVPGIVSNGYVWTVLADLAALGYDARWAIVSAADVGAPHLRERWFCLAERVDADDAGQRSDCRAVRQSEIDHDARRICEVVADSCGARRQQERRGASGNESAHEGRAEKVDNQPASGRADVADTMRDGRTGRTEETGREARAIAERHEWSEPNATGSDTIIERLERHREGGQRRGQLTDPDMGAIPAGGKLSPVWVEWLMCWPLGWTGLKLSATAKSRSKPRSHGGCSVDQ